jgi:hypothetical protein
MLAPGRTGGDFSTRERGARPLASIISPSQPLGGVPSCFGCSSSPITTNTAIPRDPPLPNLNSGIAGTTQGSGANQHKDSGGRGARQFLWQSVAHNARDIALTGRFGLSLSQSDNPSGSQASVGSNPAVGMQGIERFLWRSIVRDSKDISQTARFAMTLPRSGDPNRPIRGEGNSIVQRVNQSLWRNVIRDSKEVIQTARFALSLSRFNNPSGTSASSGMTNPAAANADSSVQERVNRFLLRSVIRDSREMIQAGRVALSRFDKPNGKPSLQASAEPNRMPTVQASAESNRPRRDTTKPRPAWLGMSAV